MSNTGVIISQAKGPLPEGVHLPLYMDNHATTPMDRARARGDDAVLHRQVRQCGQPQPRLRLGGGGGGRERARTDRQADRRTPKEIIFTSGATESNNLAIKGIAEMYREKGNHIITQVTEHKAVLDTCKKLEKQGYRVTYLPVAGRRADRHGRAAARDRDEGPNKTILVTIMYANNEIGVIQPIAEIGKLCHEKGVLFHTDAVQAVGKIPVDVQKDNIDVLSSDRPQDLRAQRCRRAVRPPPQPARADHRADQRRRPRARHALRHAERPRHRRSGQGLRDCRRGDGGRGEAR